MSYLTTLASSLWRFVSRPSSSAQSASTSASPLQPLPYCPKTKKLELGSDISMSPRSRIENWKLDSPQSQLITTPTQKNSKKRQLPTPDSSDFRNRNRKKLKLNMDVMDVDMESLHLSETDSETEELKNDEDGEWTSSEASDDDSDTPASDDEELNDHAEDADNEADDGEDVTFEDAADDISSLIEDSEDANEDTVVRRASQYSPSRLAAIETERARREAKIAGLDWPPADITVYRKLDLRGLEPLLPSTWSLDFPSLPLELFTSNDEVAFIKALALRSPHSADCRGSRALNDLLELGPRVRDALTLGRSPEAVVLKLIKPYLRWALTDADLWKTRKSYVPVLALVSASNKVSADAILKRTICKLERLEGRWTDLLATAEGWQGPATLPPLYAITVSHTAMGFSSWIFGEGVEEHAKLRTLAFFDWGNGDYDVWNAFAIAVMVVHCRNVLLEATRGLGLGEMEVDSDDPDA